jgi:hypothetical protein
MLKVQANNLFCPDRHYSYFFILASRGGSLETNLTGCSMTTAPICIIQAPITEEDAAEACDWIPVRFLG